jgi:hypothetical protein
VLHTKPIQAKKVIRTLRADDLGNKGGWKDLTEGGFTDPVKFVWKVQIQADDEYVIKLFEGPQIYSALKVGSHTGESEEVGFGSSYRVFFECSNWDNLYLAGLNYCQEVTFQYAIVSCGCPGGKLPISPCTGGTPEKAAPAVCPKPLSSEPVVGYWAERGGGPGATFSKTFGTSTTEGTSLTTEQAKALSVSVSAGFEYKAFSGSTTVTGSLSESVSNTVSKSFTTSEGTKFTVDCGKSSPTGNWIVWQFVMEQEADSTGGVGTNSETNYYSCTESSAVVPQCLAGLCGDIQCQTCVGDGGGSGGGGGGGGSGGGGGGGGGGAQEGGGGCFSEASTVQMLGKGTVPMQDIHVGDRILTGQQKYQAVYALGHYNPSKPAEFVQIQTSGENSANVLEMTGDHLVFVQGKMNPVRADSIKVGDVLQGSTMDESNKAVINVGTIQRNGLYAPLTMDGTLLVDGIKVSSYIGMQEGTSEYLELQGGIRVMSLHSFVHTTLAPLRLLCMGVSSKFCKSYTEEGIQTYVAHGIKLCQWLDHLNLNIVAQALLLMVAAFVFGTFMILEAIALHAFAFEKIVTIGIALVAYYLLSGTRKHKVKST